MSKSLALSIALMVISTFILAACGGSAAAPASNKPVEVQVTLSDFKIESSLTTFSTSVPYHFVVTNKGSVAHEFEIMPPATDPLSPEQVSKMTLAGIPTVQPGATQALDYTFTQPASAGKLEFACHLPGHYDAGMHTPIVVK